MSELEIRGQTRVTPLLKIDRLSKGYPGVQANDAISFEIAPGDIHALLGENGAGKSTLVKMIYGLIRPDSGTMHMQGQPYRPIDPKSARAAGVAMVFQHFSLFEALTVAENVALGMENPPSRQQLENRIRALSQAYNLPLDPRAHVGALSVGQRQRVEIIRCLLQDPKLLIMDEPTSVLTPQEVAALFTTLCQLSATGTAILYISHKLQEIRTLCRSATILRGGKVVAQCDPRKCSAAELAEIMVGQSFATPKSKGHLPGDAVLEVQTAFVPAETLFATPLRDVSFSVRAGEILGIGGVAGNGQDALFSLLSGERASPSGTVHFKGRDISNLGPKTRRALGIFMAPEERLGHASAPDMSLQENTLITLLGRKGTTKNGAVFWASVRQYTEDVIKAFDVRTPGPFVSARALSGGNLQKFVMGREILQSPELLVVNQPTWGVDAAAAATIRQALLDLAANGAAVVVISQDLEELLEISDRFAALNGGALSAPQPPGDLSMEQVGLMLGGLHDAVAPDVIDQDPQAPAT